MSHSESKREGSSGIGDLRVGVLANFFIYKINQKLLHENAKSFPWRASEEVHLYDELSWLCLVWTDGASFFLQNGFYCCNKELFKK